MVKAFSLERRSTYIRNDSGSSIVSLSDETSTVETSLRMRLE